MEQFDQLLTCAICLDRYRNPKLLPCQHSFCMEPCMEGLVNYVTRMVKCPECRAEHRIPYQGVQQFPTNVTLQRFLELHIEITGELPDPTSGQVMERCAVCSEKNYCSTCTHCDKKVCNDCKDGHLDIVKREIARVNNQVRRTLPRLQDALTTLDKNAQQLNHNCTNVIEEVDSIYLRLSTALKSRLDGIKTEVENFMTKEMRTISALRANVEQEIANFQSNSEFAEKHMSSSELTSSTLSAVEWDDSELMDAKEIFLRTMEFIRNFETEQGDYHRRVRFFMPQDPNQLTSTLGNLGELTILPGPNSGNNSNSLSAPTPPTLSSGLMRSKSDHRVAAQFRAQEERYGAMDDDSVTSRGSQRYFGERHNTSRLGSYGTDRRTSDFDYDDSPADSGRRTRFRSRFMRHHDSAGDSDNEPANRSVRFQQNDDGPAKKERAKVIDTEDAARGPLSGITRLADSPRVIKRLAEVESKGRRKKPTPPSSLQIPTPGTVLHQPPSPRATTGRPTSASRQVSEDDEIAKIKKQNKSQEASSGASANTAATPSERKEASVPSTPTTNERPRYSVDHSSQPSRSPAPSRQTSTTETKKEASESSTPATETAEEARARRRSGYLDNSSTTPASAPETNGRASRAASRTGSPAEGSPAGSTGSGDRSSRRVGRVSTDRFQKSSSESSTSAESSTHSSPVRNTGAAFSASELKNRFQSGSVARRSSTGSQNGDSTSAAMATTTTRSRFGNVNSSAASTTSTTSTPSSRFSTAGSSTSTTTPSTATATANGTAPHRFQSRFLGRAGTPTAEASRGSENNDSESSSSEESDSSESDDGRGKPATSSASPSAAAATAAAKDAARTDIGPLLARSAQARDNSTSLQSSSSSSTPASGSSTYASRTRGSAAGLSTTSTPATSSARQYGSSSRFLGASDTGSSGLSRSRTGSSLATDLENKYPLTSKYLNRSRANLDEYSSGGSSSRSTGRYGSGSGYQSRFLNKSKSSAALAADTDPDAADEPSAEDEPSDAAAAASPESPGTGVGGVPGDERYPSGRSRYAALKDRRSRLARSKSSHEVARNEDGPDATNGNGQQLSADAVDTGAPHSPSGEPPSPGAEASGSSLSTWARYLKNKYGPRNKESDGETGGAATSSAASSRQQQPLQQSRFSRSRSIAGSSLAPTAATAAASAATAASAKSSDDQPAVDALITSPSHHQYMQKRKMLLKFGTRGSEAGAFTWPRGVAVGPDNTIVVADSSNHRVQVFDAAGHFVKEFGYYGNGEGEFDCLAGVAINRIGQYIIADRYNHRIQVFDPSGRFLRVFGSQGSADGKFSYPWGVTTDALGFIYVCDKENHRVQVFQSDGTFVGKFGTMGNRPGQLEHPHYIAVSSTNRVIVSDSNNHRIQVFDVNGKVVTTFGHEGADEGQFKFPRGVAVDDQGYIVVADSGNNRIQVFTADGVFVKAFGCWGSGDGEFKGLEGIAVLPNGNIVCADRENHRIQVF